MTTVIASGLAVKQNQPQHARLAPLLGSLAAFASLSIDMYLPAFPQIAHEFGATLGSVQMTLSVFLAGMAVGQLLHGPLSDRYGRRIQIQIGTGIFVVSALGCAWAPSVYALMAWRFLMALGGSVGQVVPRAIVRDWFHAREAARYFSLLMAITGVSPILAPLVGGQILKYAGWREIFWLLAGFGSICLVATTALLPESHPPDRRTRGGLVEALQLYGRLFVDGRFMSAIFALGMAYGSMFCYIVGSSAVLIVGYGISAQQFGLFFGLNSFGLIGSSQLNRVLLRRHSPVRIVRVAYVAIACSAALVAILGLSGAAGFWLFAAVLFTSVALLGFIYPNMAAISLSPLGHVAGSASAVLGLFQFGLGSAAGTVLSAVPARPVVAMSLGMLAFTWIGFAALVSALRRNQPEPEHFG
jgi:DHA1 family bicyclomycin/chloramphenicol resistance-like MFS transporter